MIYKGKEIDPYESFYWNTTPEFFRGQLGGGIARCVKCDDSLAILVMEEPRVMQVGNILDDTDRSFSNPQTGRVYSPQGLSPTINTCQGGGREPKILEMKDQIQVVTQLSSSQNSRVIDPEGISYAMANGEKDGMPKIIEPMCSVHPLSHKAEFNPETSIKPYAPALRATDYKCPHCVYEPMIGAMRGRNPDNPSERGKSNGKYKQRLEMNENGTSNTITSVQKDNLVVEPCQTILNFKNFISLGEQNNSYNRVWKTDNYCGALNCTKQMEILEEQKGTSVEPQVLTPKRTEFGKQIRKQYEKGEIQMSKEINICYDKTRVSKQSNQTNPCAILQVLREIIGEKKVHWAAGRLAVVFKEEILRQGLHAQSIREEGGQTTIRACSSLIKQDSIPHTTERKEMRDMRFNTEHRCASQGFQLSEQFYREFDDFVSELSYENPQVKECLSNLRSTCEGPQSLQQTFSALEEVRRSLTHTLEHIHTPQYRIRKLTPREAFRLMGMDDADIDKIQAAGISNSQQYKLAGNSIVVAVLYHLFRKLFIETQNEERQLTFF